MRLEGLEGVGIGELAINDKVDLVAEAVELQIFLDLEQQGVRIGLEQAKAVENPLAVVGGTDGEVDDA